MEGALHTFRVRVRKGIIQNTRELHYGTSASCNCRTTAWYLLLGHYLREEPHGWEDVPGSFGIPATTKNSKRD
jgi:hypothetical protein